MTHVERFAVVHVDACVPHGFTLIGLYLFCGVERRPERGIAGSSGAAGGFLEGAMDNCHRLADDASRVAEDELVESCGRSVCIRPGGQSALALSKPRLSRAERTTTASRTRVLLTTLVDHLASCPRAPSL